MTRGRCMLCVGLLSAPLARAEAPASPPTAVSEMSLAELLDVEVTTVSRIDESADNVSVFQGSVLQNRGFRSLGELPRVAPGFTAYQPCGIEVLFPVDLRL